MSYLKRRVDEHYTQIYIYERSTFSSSLELYVLYTDTREEVSAVASFLLSFMLINRLTVKLFGWSGIVSKEG